MQTDIENYRKAVRKTVWQLHGMFLMFVIEKKY